MVTQGAARCMPCAGPVPCSGVHRLSLWGCCVVRNPGPRVTAAGTLHIDVKLHGADGPVETVTIQPGQFYVVPQGKQPRGCCGLRAVPMLAACRVWATIRSAPKPTHNCSRATHDCYRCCPGCHAPHCRCGAPASLRRRGSHHDAGARRHGEHGGRRQRGHAGGAVDVNRGRVAVVVACGQLPQCRAQVAVDCCVTSLHDGSCLPGKPQTPVKIGGFVSQIVTAIDTRSLSTRVNWTPAPSPAYRCLTTRVPCVPN